MIDNICKLGGINAPEKYNTCSYLTSTNYEQKFLYQIYLPNHKKIAVDVRGSNFSCFLNSYEPFLTVYVKAYNQYFKGNDLWSGTFLKCNLIDSNSKCKYECNCKDSVCKLVYLKWMINYEKSLNPLTNVEICDIDVTNI